MISLVSVVQFVFGGQRASVYTSQRAAAGGDVAVASQGSGSAAGSAAQASAQVGAASTSATSAASVSSASSPVTGATVSSSTSSSVAGLASVGVGTSVGAGSSKVSSAVRAMPDATGVGNLDRHFAVGMQKNAGAYAFDRLADMTAAGPDASGAAAALERSQKHLQGLLSEIATSASGDQVGDSGSAAAARVQNAYAGNAA